MSVDEIRYSLQTAFQTFINNIHSNISIVTHKTLLSTNQLSKDIFYFKRDIIRSKNITCQVLKVEELIAERIQWKFILYIYKCESMILIKSVLITTKLHVILLFKLLQLHKILKTKYIIGLDFTEQRGAKTVQHFVFKLIINIIQFAFITNYTNISFT